MARTRGSISAIMEGLNQSRSFVALGDSYTGDIHEGYNYDLCESYFGELPIDEAKVVTFGGDMYPKGGWAMILAGGSGSGKGFIRSHKVALDAKVLDVDKLKELYVSAAKRGIVKDEKGGNYNFKNPEDVGALHQIVKKHGYKDSQENSFFRASANLAPEDKPNVIYDITGDDPKKLASISKKVKEMGYKVSLVWVVTNREEAYIRNLKRSRVVPQSIFHATHNDVHKAVKSFLSGIDAKYCDEAWIAFGSGGSAKELTKDEQEQLHKMGVIKLDKSGNTFEIPADVESKVEEILGPDEPNPENPQNYLHYDEFGNVSLAQLDGMNFEELMKVAGNLGFDKGKMKELKNSKDADFVLSAIKDCPETEIKYAIQIENARKGNIRIRKDV